MNSGPTAKRRCTWSSRGRVASSMGDEDVMASPGSLLSVPARVEHRFHSIEQDLLLLVFFAPAEGSAKKEAVD